MGTNGRRLELVSDAFTLGMFVAFLFDQWEIGTVLLVWAILAYAGRLAVGSGQDTSSLRCGGRCKVRDEFTIKGRPASPAPMKEVDIKQ